MSENTRLGNLYLAMRSPAQREVCFSKHGAILKRRLRSRFTKIWMSRPITADSQLL